jgi:hypothetical protein
MKLEDPSAKITLAPAPKPDPNKPDPHVQICPICRTDIWTEGLGWRARAGGDGNDSSPTPGDLLTGGSWAFIYIPFSVYMCTCKYTHVYIYVYVQKHACSHAKNWSFAAILCHIWSLYYHQPNKCSNPYHNHPSVTQQPADFEPSKNHGFQLCGLNAGLFRLCWRF